jgi:hypothetical protein
VVVFLSASCSHHGQFFGQFRQVFVGWEHQRRDGCNNLHRLEGEEDGSQRVEALNMRKKDPRPSLTRWGLLWERNTPQSSSNTMTMASTVPMNARLDARLVNSMV